MSDSPILVVGASRGIGAELVRQYLSDGAAVHATVRDLAVPGELAGVAGDLTLHRLDVRDEAAGHALAASLAGANLAAIIHNAGIYRGHTAAEMMEVNAVAPIRLVEQLLEVGAHRHGGVVAIMSSQMGARRGSSASLGPYGDSKAALNDEFRKRASSWADLGAIAVVVHPGWVRTDMGGSGASIDVTESASGIRSLIDGLTSESHGRFWTWDGREHPW